MSFEQLRELDPLLMRIDALQQQVDELKVAQPDAYDRIMEGWAIESTYNSNNIEGSTLSLGDTALLYEGVPVDAPADDVRQAEGGFAALRFLSEAVATKAPFSEQVIKRAHELIFAEAKDPKTRGAYRSVEVEITGTEFQPAPAAYVSERMRSLVASIGRSRKHTAITASLFHLEFESIHPFVNANGRTGRLMSNLLLMQAGYEPVNIQAESRARYVAAIRSFQLDDDPYPFVAFFCLNLAERLERVLALLSSEGAVGSGGGEVGSALDAYLVDDEDIQSATTEIPKCNNCTLEELRLLEAMAANPTVTQTELAEIIGKSPRTVKARTVSLQERGLIRRVGGKRNGWWEVLVGLEDDRDEL